MWISRRRFLQMVLSLPVIAHLKTGFARAALPQVQTPALRLACGDTTQTSTVLWAISATNGDLTFEHAADSTFGKILGTLKANVTDPALPVKVNVDNLTPGTRYYYRVTDSAKNSILGTFRAAHAVGSRAGLHFGVSGDWRQELAPYPSIKNVPSRDLDFFVKLGDTIYSDFPSPDVPVRQARTLAEYRAKHNEAISTRYGMNTWNDVHATTSILATIDDHEVANDFAGGASPASNPIFDKTGNLANETMLYKNGMQTFAEYMPIRSMFYGETGDPRTSGKPKLYRVFTYGSDATLFILDARSFRDANLEDPAQVTDPAQVEAFWKASFNPERTMLGKQQLADLKADLLKAKADGTTWKFIVVPEPVQGFGPINGGDRFEGFAAERSDLMKYIMDNKIANVAFIAADIHGTIVNNLTYQTGPGSPHLPTGMWEISTGPVAFDAPFGPVVIDLLTRAGLVKPEQQFLYNALPIPGKDAFMKRVMQEQYKAFNLDPVGLNDPQIDATLIKGDYIAVNTFGWTEFEIDAETQALTVTTYGIAPYSKAQLDANPTAITGREPQIISQFSVKPAQPASK